MDAVGIIDQEKAKLEGELSNALIVAKIFYAITRRNKDYILSDNDFLELKKEEQQVYFSFVERNMENREEYLDYIEILRAEIFV